MVSEYLENLKARWLGGDDKLEENRCEKIQSISSLYQLRRGVLDKPNGNLPAST